MAAETSRSSPSPDSYIGSLITLTSKSEIRYEGILYNINTEESSIGLRNVRSFGTEGRKKDGSQVPASDKIYEYILFRGSDIKDLQVKASPPVQTAPSHNDPAIIQSHYPRPQAAASSSLPPHGTGASPELSSYSGQVGLQRPIFQGTLPQYPTVGGLGTWGHAPPPPNASGTGLAVPPMFWQGYYAPPSGGLSHLQQPPLMRPLPGLALPPMQQAVQFQGMNPSLSSGTPNYLDFSPLFPTVSSNVNLASTSLAPIQASQFSPEMLQNSLAVKGGAIPARPSSTLSTNLLSVSPLTQNLENLSSSLPQNTPSVVSGQPWISSIATMSHLAETQPGPSSLATVSLNQQAETSVKLVTPGQLVPNPSVLPSSHNKEKKPLKNVEVKLQEDQSKPLLPEPPAPQRESSIKTKPPVIAKEPILPLPIAPHKHNGAILVNRESSRGRGRGRGNMHPPQTKTMNFTEDFDFTAMNEKFNKDEVWGHLGKSRPHPSNIEEDDEADDGLEEEHDHSGQSDIKPVYVKDDFFDTLSCSVNNQSSNGRIKFSEQLKIDTETFGNFPRNRSAYRGGRGVRGGRGRGPYYGRGYGFTGRGRAGHSTGAGPAS